MKKIKIGISFFLMCFACILCGQFVLLINYILALSLHELAHLFVATKRGYSLKIIRLDMFGLAVELKENIDDRDAFAINVAGPVLNILLSIICMALYWLIPISFLYLNTFCIANIGLAIFNLLPIYPLDGGKIFRGLIHSDKVYRVLDGVIRYTFTIVFAVLFAISCRKSINLLFLILAVFFFTSRPSKVPTMSIFKFSQNKSFDKVIMLKVTGEEDLFSLVKQIKRTKYTIFYYASQDKFIDEDLLIDYATRFPLYQKLKEVK